MGATTADELVRENESLRRALDSARRYDPLTDLLTREAFYADAAALMAQHSDTHFSILCFDICRFKLVNDMGGFEDGDNLLRAFSYALVDRYPLNAPALVSRLGGDTFVVLAPTESGEATKEALTSISHACPSRYNVVAVVGVYGIDDRTLPVGIMCDRALMAMRAAKGSYFGRVSFYQPGMRDALMEERAVQEGIEAALAADQIEPFFQPKCNIRTGKIVGAEALVRWRDPQRGIVAPGEFIPLLERSGFIRVLDRYMWEKTAAWMADLNAKGVATVPISVNVSRTDIEGMDVCATLQDIIARYNLKPSQLEVEITESAYAEDRESIIKASESLMNSGFTVLMDDFGSGYSSLNMLKDINVNVLKIDMRFLDRADRRSRDIMESVVHMARWLNLPVIAEGVETDDQVDFLLDVGCSFAQGFHFYRPMDADTFAALLTDGEAVESGDTSERLVEDAPSVFDFKDLLHEDVISDRMLSNILGAVALYSYDDGVLRAVRGNSAYQRLIGADRINESVFDRCHPDDRALLADAVDRARNSHNDEGVKVVIRSIAYAQARWFELHLFCLHAYGENNMLYSSVVDVTERMEDIEALRMSERRFELAMEATGLVVFELDIPMRTIRCSEYAQRLLGMDSAEARVPEYFIESGGIDKVSVDDFREVYETIYQGADHASTVVRSHMANDVTAWNRVTLMTVRDAAGRPSRAVGLVENVTREKEMDLTLGQQVLARLNEANQRTLIELIRDNIVFGLVGRYIEQDFPQYFASVDFIAMLGYDSYTDFIEHTGGITRDVVVEAARVEGPMINRKPGDTYLEHYHLRRKDGSTIFVEDRGVIVRTEDGRRASLSINIMVPEEGHAAS